MFRVLGVGLSMPFTLVTGLHPLHLTCTLIGAVMSQMIANGEPLRPPKPPYLSPYPEDPPFAYPQPVYDAKQALNVGVGQIANLMVFPWGP